MTVTGKELDKAILKALSYLKVGETQFKEYINFCNGRLDQIDKENSEKLSSKTLAINRVRGQRKSYIKANMSLIRDTEEEEIYQEEKKQYDKNIAVLSKEIGELDKSERNQILELELFIDMLNKAKEYYEKASYVRRRKIVKILFSNIEIDHKKRLLVKPKPGLENLFTVNWWS